MKTLFNLRNLCVLAFGFGLMLIPSRSFAQCPQLVDNTLGCDFTLDVSYWDGSSGTPVLVTGFIITVPAATVPPSPFDIGAILGPFCNGIVDIKFVPDVTSCSNWSSTLTPGNVVPVADCSCIMSGINADWTGPTIMIN